MTQTLSLAGNAMNPPNTANAVNASSNASRGFLPMMLTSLERTLLRLLVVGYSLEETARSVGLSLQEAEATLRELQRRCGVSGVTRLLALAILKSWV